MRKILMLAAGCLPFVFLSCQTLPDVPTFEPQKHCDPEMQKQAKSFLETGRQPTVKPRELIAAISECGKYGHMSAEELEKVALELRDKSSIFEPVKNGATITVLIEILMAIIYLSTL